MFLKSITINGFKSFAKKIVIDLSHDVTGIVGPNGSGKSNVAEALRFVLGEQSMKGLRSKSGNDLIFKGSQNLSALSRASVSIKLDNTEKKKDQKLISSTSELNETLNNFINLDEIILTREVYADGQSDYSINNIKVRLKDVQELLALAQISTTGHSIINQGETDKILLSNNKDRRDIIEESLGLRIYHLRIKESEKKLEKVAQHLKEIDIQRKENIPHLNFLQRQIEKLENREKEKENILALLKIYLKKEDEFILKLKDEIKKEDFDFTLIQKYKLEIKDLENKKLSPIETSQISQEKEKVEDEKIFEQKNILQKINEEISEIKNNLIILNQNYEIAYKESINLDLEIKFLEKKYEYKKLFIEEEALDNFESIQKRLWYEVFSDFEKENLSNTKINLTEIRQNEQKFIKDISGKYDELGLLNSKNNLKIKKDDLEIIRLQKIELENNFENLKTQERNIEKELERENERQKISLENQNKENSFEFDNKILSFQLELQKMESKKENLEIRKENLRVKENNFENILAEIHALIGGNILGYKNFEEENYLNDNLISENSKKIITLNLKLDQIELFRKIERSKIKIEEIGLTNTGEIVEEYQTLKNRDEFLNKEIEDLTKSQSILEELIKNLENNLLTHFEEGLKIINDNFNNYFMEIFSGGKASLTLETVSSENKKIKEENDFELECDEKDQKEPGINISVSLPQKKIKDLQMLSGGEKALTSIALIFALTSINHPPFIVLDETDAALDEANAKRYGKMIQKLSEKSKLLVITHNRETMNQCDVLYGVTVGVEGSSKLLSIKFEDAAQYAK